MKKLTKKWQLILYGCSGMGVNMLNLIVGSYLCSALLVGGFEENAESWTYLNRDLVVAALWSVLMLASKVIDGIIDLPFSSFADNLCTKWGRRRPAIVMGFVPMIVAYLLFLVPLNNGATVLNTVWFALMLMVFYGCYTLTMLTFYATFAEVVDNKDDVVLISNTKSICDVVYFVLGYALLPVFVGLGVNIRIVALIFLPLSLTMLIPLFLLKEEPTNTSDVKLDTKPRITLWQSISYTFKCKEFIIWMCTASVMNIGLQLFLGGINEFFSSTGLNMTFVMASVFVPVPLTIMLYNWVVKKKGLGFAYRYILIVYSIGMLLMYLCNGIDRSLLLPFAIGCGVITSFSIGSFFSVTYIVPSHIAASRKADGESASSMFFAVQGLFEGVATGIATGVILVYLKGTENNPGPIHLMTLIVAAACMTAFVMSFFLPKSITQIGKAKK
ncbi:MAG: MFS transporter [Clostridia bacterium]|nr:MFS transporter [Clostridia bacterium]